MGSRGILTLKLRGYPGPWLTLTPHTLPPSHCWVWAGSRTLSAVGTTGGVRMLGGDSGRFLCFCLRRSLSFRLWGRKSDQILVLRDIWGKGKHDIFMWVEDPSQR